MHRPPQASRVADSVLTATTTLDGAVVAEQDDNLPVARHLTTQADAILRIAVWRLRHEPWAVHPETLEWADDLAGQVDRARHLLVAGDGLPADDGDIAHGKPLLADAVRNLRAMAGLPAQAVAA